MKSTRRIITIILIVAVIFGFTLYFSSGSVELKQAGINIIVEKGDVWHKTADNNDFEKITGIEKASEGDIVKTGSNSVARISFFDTQEAMLAENSEVVIVQAFIDEKMPLLTQVTVKLRKGEVWSRLLDLLHPAASFKIESGSIIAATRGAAFNVSLSETSTEVFVYENMVEVYDKDKQELLSELNPGDSLTYSFLDSKSEIEHVASADLKTSLKENPWIYNNMQMNKEFEKYLVFRRTEIIDKIGPLPETGMFKFKLLSEKLGQLFSSNKDEYKRNIKLKRAIEAQALIDQSQIESAINHLHKYNISRMTSPDFSRLQALDPEFINKLNRHPAFKLFIFTKMLNDQEVAFISAKLDQIEPENSDSNQ